MSTSAILSVANLLDIARARLTRLDPVSAEAAWRSGATLVDIRPADQRRVEGEVPGALVVERNVLEWRFDPASDARLPEASYDLQVVVLCSEGYTSSLAAHALQQLGVRRATDVIGGYQAWSRAGLPTTRRSRLTLVRDRPDPDTRAGWRSRSAHGDLLVEPEQRSVRVGDRDVDLTRTEFDLLAYLLDAPQRVHTRRRLLDALWPAKVEAGPRAVDVHVHRLRSKLGSPWAETLVTVRSVGYRWAAPVDGTQPGSPASRRSAIPHPRLAYAARMDTW